MSLWINFNPMNHPGPIGHLHQPPWSRWCWLGSSQPREWILWVYQDQPVKVVEIPWWFPKPFSKQDAKIHLMIMNDHWWFIFYVRWFSMVFYHFDPFCIIRHRYVSVILRMFKKFLPAWRSWVHQLWVHLESTHGITHGIHHGIAPF